MTTPIPLGRLLLVERLAIGGMAEVWAAVPRGEPERPCAVKRLLPTVAEDRELVRMFLAEGRLGARLAHPGIVPVLEVGEAGGRHHLVMEYVAGRDLRALVQRLGARGEALPVELAAHVAARVADALDHLHRWPGGGAPGTIHGDVSPANVLVGLDGRVRVIDLGLAQEAGGRAPAGAAPRGKLSYLSPERVDGRPVDPRSDVFALGAVLHELLTGRRLFAGATGDAVVQAVRAARAAPPSRANRAVPPELDRIVLRALAREPADRFARARDLRDALGALGFGAGAGEGDAGSGAGAALAALLARAFPEGADVEEARRARLRRAALGG